MKRKSEEGILTKFPWLYTYDIPLTVTAFEADHHSARPI
jgi:hypothetical protein